MWEDRKEKKGERNRKTYFGNKSINVPEVFEN